MVVVDSSSSLLPPPIKKHCAKIIIWLDHLVLSCSLSLSLSLLSSTLFIFSSSLFSFLFFITCYLSHLFLLFILQSLSLSILHLFPYIPLSLSSFRVCLLLSSLLNSINSPLESSVSPSLSRRNPCFLLLAPSLAVPCLRCTYDRRHNPSAHPSRLSLARSLDRYAGGSFSVLSFTTILPPPPRRSPFFDGTFCSRSYIPLSVFLS